MLQKFSACIIICIAIATTSHAQLFSFANKYRVSDQVLDSIAASVCDTGTVVFVGQPAYLIAQPQSHLFTLTSGSQSVSTEISLTGMVETRNDSALGNYFATAHVAYLSPHLKAEVQYDLHSVNGFPKTTLADIMSSDEVERVNTGYNHVQSTDQKDFNFPLGYLQLNYAQVSVLVGKYKLRWGPGYKGTLGLSGTTFSPFYFYSLQLKMGSILTASTFLNGFDDNAAFDAASQVDPFKQRYGAGQRIDLRIGKHVQIGVYEFVDFYGVDLLNRFANPLQIYYLGDVAGGNSVSDGSGEQRTNVMGGLDCSVLLPRSRIYFDFLDDDITMFSDDKAPNKFAFQIGGAYYPSRWITEIGAEYTHVSYGTYTHRNPGLGRHIYWGESRGWPWGNDQDLWHARIRARLPFNISLLGELNWWIKDDGAMDVYHWDIRDANPVLFDSLDLKNTGNFVDYKTSRQLFEPLIEVSAMPWKYISLGLNYRSAFSTGRPMHYVKFFTTVMIPGNFVFGDNSQSDTKESK